MSIRLATAADAAALARVQYRAWRLAYAEILDPQLLAELDEPACAARWGEILAAAESTAWVFDQDGQIVAFASVAGGAMLALYVDPVAQGAGVGSALHERAVRAGARELTVFAANAAARAFYEHKGWTLDGPAGEAMGAPTVRYRC